MPIRFMGKDLPSFVKGSVRMSMFPVISQSLLTVAGRAGSYDFGNVVGNRQITFDYFILYQNKADLIDKMRSFAEWLYSEKAEKLELTRDPNRFYYAKISGETTYSEDNKVGKGSIIFLCTDPYIYGMERVQQLNMDSATSVTNNGGMEACPIIDVTFKQDTTIFNFECGSDKMVFGEAEQIGKTKPTQPQTEIVVDSMDTTNGWSGGVGVDGVPLNGEIKSQSGQFRLVNVGSGSGWHGAALVRGLPEEIQDFTLETVFNLHSSNISQLARIEISLLDKLDILVGKISLSDYQASMHDPIFEARTGTTSFASSSGGVSRGFYSNFNGRLTLQKVGTRWYAEIARRVKLPGSSHIIHFDRWSKNFVDETITNKVSKIQVAILAYGNYVLNDDTGIESLTFYKENLLDDDTEIPIIFKAGDNLTIDSEKGIVTKNDEPCFYLLDGFSSFPMLKRGTNTISMFPVGEGTIKYRERWLS